MTKTLTIVSWHGEEDIPSLDDPKVWSCCGGIWRDDPPWELYIGEWSEAARPHLECLKAHIVENGIRNGGFWHQAEGIPQFSDGVYLFLSMRAWGDLMAAIWGGHYCHYAWER